MPVAVVNETFARQYFPGQEALGKQVRWEFVEPPQWMTIVGVIGDVRHSGLDQPQEPTAYTPLAQNPQPWKRWAYVVVRPRSQDAEQLLGSVKQALWSVDPQLPVGKVQPMSEVVGEAVSQRRFNMLLLAIFAGLALSLAIVGIYGVMSYAVVPRRHEIGIRMALGAQRLDVARMVLRQGMIETAIGLAGGSAGAVALTRAMRGMLFGVEPVDPLTFTAVTALLLLVAVAACVVPARRATRVDPMVALRYE
jgi:putative ABC transport system permease protein